MSSKKGCFGKFKNDIRRLCPKFLKRRSKKSSEESSPLPSNALSASENQQNETTSSKVVATVEDVNRSKDTENGVSFHTSDVEDEVGVEKVKLGREETRFDVKETIEEDVRKDGTSTKVYTTEESAGASLKRQKDNFPSKSLDVEDIPKSRNEEEEREKCTNNANGQCIDDSATKDATVSDKRKEPTEDEARERAEQRQINIVTNEQDDSKEEQRDVTENVHEEVLRSTLKETNEDKRVKTEESKQNKREKERQDSENTLEEQSQQVSYIDYLNGEMMQGNVLSTFVPMIMIIILIIMEKMFIEETQ